MVTDSPSATETIEFWSTIAETEKDLEEPEFEEDDNSHQFARKILSSLLPRLCANLLKQVDCTEDEEEWNIASASAACITILAECTDVAILENILPFIKLIKNENWRQREASTMAFGSIICDQISDEKFAEVVGQVLPILLDHLTNDPNDCVKSTSAWAISKSAYAYPEVISRDTGAVLKALVSGLSNEDEVIARFSCLVSSYNWNFEFPFGGSI